MLFADQSHGVEIRATYSMTKEYRKHLAQEPSTGSMNLSSQMMSDLMANTLCVQSRLHFAQI